MHIIRLDDGTHVWVQRISRSPDEGLESLDEDVAAQARLNTALSAIDSTPSSLHFLDLKVTGSPTRPLSTKKLRSALKS